jgi:hypothetical protein
MKDPNKGEVIEGAWIDVGFDFIFCDWALSVRTRFAVASPSVALKVGLGPT